MFIVIARNFNFCITLSQHMNSLNLTDIIKFVKDHDKCAEADKIFQLYKFHEIWAR